MKKISTKIILSAILVLSINMISCDQRQPENPIAITQNGDFVIKIIDNCEYIEYNNGMYDYDMRVYSITHKGNCKFCEERKNSKK